MLALETPEVPCAVAHIQLSSEALVAAAIHRGEARYSDSGALLCYTGKFTGRSPKDKFIVKDTITSNQVAWGEINQPFQPEKAEALYQKMLTFLENREVFVQYARAGAEKKYRLNVTVITTTAWQALFAQNMFIGLNDHELAIFQTDWTVLSVPEFEADHVSDGTRQTNFSVIDFTNKRILVGGTAYAGEIKKGIFTVLNFLLPVENQVLSMHCSANVGASGDTALFFGLSGTGKTTLSADPTRHLVGDDEHGWADEGVFNIEGGCYAKVINLNAANEPQIFQAIRPGAILENVGCFSGTNMPDFSDTSLTENTRVSYPLDFIPGALQPSVAASPKNIFFLTADAFGVLPPLSKLTPTQAMYHFLSGFTSKLAGTEMGITTPVVTFSACFGAAFLPLAPIRYAQLLGERIKKSGANVWLINTGWSGGGYGFGKRIALPHTRAMITAVLNGSLNDVVFTPHETFGLMMPNECPGVPSEILDPAKTWATQSAYQQQANILAKAFQKNFEQFDMTALTVGSPEPLLEN